MTGYYSEYMKEQKTRNNERCGMPQTKKPDWIRRATECSWGRATSNQPHDHEEDSIWKIVA